MYFEQFPFLGKSCCKGVCKTWERKNAVKAYYFGLLIQTTAYFSLLLGAIKTIQA